MKNSRKTKAQLILEMEELHARIAILESSSSIQPLSDGADLRTDRFKIDSIMFNAKGFGIYQVELASDKTFEIHNTFASPAIKDILGIENLDDNANWFANIHPDDTHRVTMAHQMFHGAGDDVFDETFRNYHPIKKEWSWIRVISSSGLSKDGTCAVFNGLIMDVTETKQDEEDLAYKTMMLDNILQSASDVAIATTDMDMIITFYNPMAEKLFGYSAREVIGKTVMDIHKLKNVSPDRLKKAIERVHSTGEYCYSVVQEIDGAPRYLDSRVSAIFNTSGETVGYCLFSRDVTAGRLAEEKLHESRERYRKLVESTADLVWAIDLKGFHTFTNNSIQSILGYETSEVLGKSVFSMMYPDDREHIKKVFARGMKKKEGWSNVEIRWVHKDGSVRILESTARPLFDSDGEVVGFTGIDRDVTDHRKAQQALLKSENDMRALFNAMTDVVFEMDYDGNYINIAPTSPSLMYKPVSTIVGKKLHQVFPEADADRFLAFVRECLDKTEALTIEYPLSIGDRTVWFEGRATPKTENTVLYIATDITRRKHLEEQARHRLIALTQPEVELGDLSLTDVIGLDMLQDIQDALADAFKLPSVILSPDGAPITVPSRLPSFCELIQSTDAGMFRCLKHHRRQMRSMRKDLTPQVRRGCALSSTVFGSVPIMLQGRHLGSWVIGQMIIGDLDGDEVRQYADEVGVDREKLLVAAGSIASVETEAFKYTVDFLNTLSSQLSLLALQNLQQARNISASEEALVEHQRLMSAIEQAAETVVITDVHGKIEYVNPAFEQTTGYSKNEAIGQNPSFLQSGKHDDSFYSEIWETLSTGETWSGKLINRKKDDTFFTEEATISPVKNSSGDIVNYVAVKRNITVEVKLEEQLRQAQKMEAVGQLAGGVAHDFNNLLQVINGYTALTLAELDKNHPAREFVQEVVKAGERARTLVSQLLSFSRQQIINPVDLDLNEVIENLMKMIRRVIGEHIQYEFIPGHNLGTIHADWGQMEQVLINLCLNSRDALPQGGRITIETENVFIDNEYARTHSGSSPGRYTLLSVSDNGCGMDKKTMDSIFNPFFTTKPTGEGTGLGMSTVYGIVKQHHGEIQVYSEPDKGTIFKIYMPIVQRRAVHVSREVNGPVPTGTETILVAEDDEMVLSLTRETLTIAGYNVIEAGNGPKALELFNGSPEKISLLMLDVVMPGLGGKEVYDKIRETHPDVPALFSSGYSHNAVHTGFVLDKDLNFIQKPFSPDTLLRKIRKMLDT